MRQERRFVTLECWAQAQQHKRQLLALPGELARIVAAANMLQPAERDAFLAALRDFGRGGTSA